MRIEVSEADIKNGTRNDSVCCPVALACRRHGLNCTQVGISRVFYMPEGYHGFIPHGVLLPYHVTLIITRYDQGHDIEPFSFDIPVEDDPDLVVRNAVTCGICHGPADRYVNRFQCQHDPNHVGDLNVGIFSDLTPPEAA